MRNRFLATALSSILIAAAPFDAGAQEAPPLQINARVRVEPTPLGASFQRRIRPGEATMSVKVKNRPAGETAQVLLHFDYNISADLALDEIISLIVISIEDTEGHEFSRATIDPNDINLNPNRVPLDYSATLYTANVPNAASGYMIHIRVFGNYE